MAVEQIPEVGVSKDEKVENLLLESVQVSKYNFAEIAEAVKAGKVPPNAGPVEMEICHSIEEIKMRLEHAYATLLKFDDMFQNMDPSPSAATS